MLKLELIVAHTAGGTVICLFTAGTSNTLFRACKELICWAPNEDRKMNVRFFKFQMKKIYGAFWKVQYQVSVVEQKQLRMTVGHCPLYLKATNVHSIWFLASLVRGNSQAHLNTAFCSCKSLIIWSINWTVNRNTVAKASVWFGEFLKIFMSTIISLGWLSHAEKGSRKPHITLLKFSTKILN